MQHTILQLQFCEISKKELAVRKVSHNYAQNFVCLSVGYYPQKGYILTVPQILFDKLGGRAHPSI